MAHQLSLFAHHDDGGNRELLAKYRRVRNLLLAAHPGHATVVRPLALAGIRHQDGDSRRIVVRGRDGATARALLRSLSSALNLLFHEIDAPALAETNWHGTDLGVHLNQFVLRSVAAHGPAVSTDAAAHACILLRRLDGIRQVGSYASASTHDHRVGQQRSLVPLLEGADISVDRSGGFTFCSADALVAVAADLQGLPNGTPDVADLVSWGLLPELAEVLGQATWIHLSPPSAAVIEGEIRRGVGRLESLFRSWGYRLIVTEQVLRHVLRAITDGPLTGDSQAASRWIESGCEAGLIRLIEDGAGPGATWVLAVDDLTLPSIPKGVWRE
ncbi:MAG: hypothetical protein ACYC6F_17515 [Longimicrobiales bacterium]